MAYEHGIKNTEVATSIVPATETNAGMPVYVGTAPIHLATSAAKANTAVLCYEYDEAVYQFGYSTDWSKYTLCEAMYAHFSLFGKSPVVFINVLDPENDKYIKKQDAKEITITNKKAEISDAVIISSLKITTGEAPATVAAVLGTDYTAAYNDDGKLIITALDGGKLASTAKCTVAYSTVDVSVVTKDDIIGGVSTTDGKKKGLELIDDVFPRFRLIPGQILAPGFSQNSDVAAVMAAKASNICGCFKAIAVVDVEADKYTDVPGVKETNNLDNAEQVVCWPRVKLSDKQYHLSTQAACVICTTDANHNDIPYKSPSNESLQADSACTKDGSEVFLSKEEAQYLNGQGIVTALNWIGGWKLWGNRTGIYPGSTDPKDAFIAMRRMFNWVNNELITTYWSKIDDPINKVLIQSVVDSANIWLNGLANEGALLGGEVKFLQSENPDTSLIDGVVKFHVYLGTPTPARKISFVMEYYPKYLSSLFTAD